MGSGIVHGVGPPLPPARAGYRMTTAAEVFTATFIRCCCLPRALTERWAELPRYDVRVEVRMEAVARADRHRRPRARGRSCTRAREWQRHNLFVHQVHSPPAAAPGGPPGGAYVRALLSRREDDSALHTRLTRPRTAKSS